MNTWYKAMRDVRTQKAAVRVHHCRAHCALRVLEHQYRIAPAWPLGMAAIGGAVLGYSRKRLPRGVVSTIWRWGLLLGRGLL
ncbi:hypothetical protein [Oleiagrimonas sp.]|jgi:hypothetical protein|uniref:hypothetical protein n=1 Tax=Oleiagrimonas sp. TaxID=2010330 RepID=UPI0026061E4A|nr:hypothetical protein [Oleiagrimonas sp.]MDA3914905.1 hypothetical protein [Oleiagrimonas sp.]